MGLETGTYPSDFVLTNPTAGDPKAQGDDHFRLIKTCVQNALPIGAANYPLTAGTATSASGTSVDFTSIPSWAKRITFQFESLSTNGTSTPMIQLGDSGGIEATGYLGGAANTENATAVVAANSTTGFLLAGLVGASSVLHGVAVLTLINPSTNTWVCAINGALSNGAVTVTGGGRKLLSATLDRVRLTTVGGANTFDSGVVNVLYE
jgi:hypothetical protein